MFDKSFEISDPTSYQLFQIDLSSKSWTDILHVDNILLRYDSAAKILFLKNACIKRLYSTWYKVVHPFFFLVFIAETTYMYMYLSSFILMIWFHITDYIKDIRLFPHFVHNSSRNNRVTNFVSQHEYASIGIVWGSCAFFILHWISW